jgi:hypothetical protein
MAAAITANIAKSAIIIIGIRMGDNTQNQLQSIILESLRPMNSMVSNVQKFMMV